MTVAESRKEYNILLERFHNAEKYFDRQDIPYAEKEKHLGNFQAILKGLSHLLTKVGPYTEREVMEGFHV